MNNLSNNLDNNLDKFRYLCQKNYEKNELLETIDLLGKAIVVAVKYRRLKVYFCVSIFFNILLLVLNIFCIFALDLV